MKETVPCSHRSLSYLMTFSTEISQHEAFIVVKLVHWTGIQTLISYTTSRQNTITLNAILMTFCDFWNFFKFFFGELTLNIMSWFCHKPCKNQHATFLKPLKFDTVHTERWDAVIITPSFIPNLQVGDGFRGGIFLALCVIM